MKIFVIKTRYEFDLKLKELTDMGYYLGSKESKFKQLVDFRLPQWFKDALNPLNLKSLVIYVGIHKDEPMKLEWEPIFIKPEKIGTSLKEIKKNYPEAEIQFIGNCKF